MWQGEGRKSMAKKEVIALLKIYSTATSHLQTGVKCGSPRKDENESAKFEAIKTNKESPKLLGTHTMTGLVQEPPINFVELQSIIQQIFE